MIKKAKQQLSYLQGRAATFFTSVAISHGSAKPKAKCSVSKVLFKKLTKSQISNYVNLDKPINCAGSFKSEALGISLFEYIKSDDPTALIGLPMIALISLLEENDISPI